MYWLWRQHWAGHELVHGSVLTPEGRPVHVFGEIQQTSREFDAASDFITGTRVKADVALHYTSKSWQLFHQQPIFDRNDYSWQVRKIHHAIMKEGVTIDVAGARKDLDGYKVLFSPLQMTLEDDGMMEKIRAWVENGGVWVAGPMTDIRNSIGAHYTDRAMGMLEEMLGIRQDYAVPTDGSYLRAAWNDGEELECQSWTECYTNLNGGEALASVTGGHSALVGETVVGRYKYGKGEVILCGTLMNDEGLSKLIRIALADAGVTPVKTSGNVDVVCREGEKSGMILCETAFRDAWVELPGKMKNVLTGEEAKGRIEIKPYDVVILETV